MGFLRTTPELHFGATAVLVVTTAVLGGAAVWFPIWETIFHPLSFGSVWYLQLAEGFTHMFTLLAGPVAALLLAIWRLPRWIDPVEVVGDE